LAARVQSLSVGSSAVLLEEAAGLSEAVAESLAAARASMGKAVAGSAASLRAAAERTLGAAPEAGRNCFDAVFPVPDELRAQRRAAAAAAAAKEGACEVCLSCAPACLLVTRVGRRRQRL